MKYYKINEIELYEFLLTDIKYEMARIAHGFDNLDCALAQYLELCHATNINEVITHRLNSYEEIKE